MHAFVALLFFLAQPFWEARPPEKWTDREVATMLEASPWVLTTGPEPSIHVYLATAAPIEQAESESRARSKKPIPMLDPDYLDYIRENREQVFILAIPYHKLADAGRAEENKRMETDTEMKVGRKTYKILGHFPPTETDPVLRLVFPRAVKPSDKSVDFDLYIPGVSFPERTVTFYVKDLLYHGKLEM
jgi:hypothetical protein